MKALILFLVLLPVTFANAQQEMLQDTTRSMNEEVQSEINNEVDTQATAEEAPLPRPDEFTPVEKQPQADMNELANQVKYPELARKAGIEGKVIVRVLIDKNGKVIKSLIQLTDNILLNAAAVDAVTKTQWEPAIRDGKPVAVWVSVPIQFKLSDRNKTPEPEINN